MGGGRQSENTWVLLYCLTANKGATDDFRGFVHATPTVPFTFVRIVTNSVSDTVFAVFAFAWIGILCIGRSCEDESPEDDEKPSRAQG